MQLTIRTLCLLVAVILFLVAAFGVVDLKGISLIALGLAFFAASFLLPDTVLGARRP
jgi:hypothetical protein